jgi:hypothetical protein
MTRVMMLAALLVVAMAGVVLVRTSGDDAADGGAAGAAVRTGLWERMQAAAGHTPVDATRAALRRNVHTARRAPGRVPVMLQAKVRASLGVPADVPFEDAHRLTTPHGALWLVDLRRATCIIRARDGALACDTTAHVAHRGLVLNVYAVTRGRRHDFVLFGLAPDGARRARVRIGHRVREVAVRGNAYAAGAREPITLDRLLRRPDASSVKTG